MKTPSKNSFFPRKRATRRCFHQVPPCSGRAQHGCGPNGGFGDSHGPFRGGFPPNFQALAGGVAALSVGVRARPKVGTSGCPAQGGDVVTQPKSLPGGQTRASAGAQQHPSRAAAGQGSRGPNPAPAADRQPCQHLRWQVWHSSPPVWHPRASHPTPGCNLITPSYGEPPIKHPLHHGGRKREQNPALSLKSSN